MSGFSTNAGENYVLSLLSAKVQPLAAYYIALIGTLPPSPFISGFELDEPNVAEYARVLYQNTPGSWSEPTGEISNSYEARFPTAEQDWGTLEHWAVCDSQEGGEVLWAGDFEVPLDISTGDTVVLPPGALTLRAANYRTRLSL